MLFIPLRQGIRKMERPSCQKLFAMYLTGILDLPYSLLTKQEHIHHDWKKNLSMIVIYPVQT